ncbi:hypothetical protein [uncultured Pseudacidovorax sp.]|uniref:hypothetical protein n=1 Tax=uncultured Pseudacidovorax sp. TaxID=679313 RepID=UPI0025D490AC|nr:hypothetical protein [uncultured Pseudacidovorax sp.]
MSTSIDKIRVGLDCGRICLADLLAMRQELRAPFRFHPLGFIACTLMAEGPLKLRLHYWPVYGGVQQSQECQIHDHLFEFQSWVLSGAVENIEYEASAIGNEYAVYETKYRDDQSILIKTGQLLSLVERSRIVFEEGESYSVAAGTLHETVRFGGSPALTVLVANDVSSKAPVVLGSKAGLDSYCYQRSVVEEAVVERLLAAD